MERIIRETDPKADVVVLQIPNFCATAPRSKTSSKAIVASMAT
nr:hypothetical protein [Bradyrhizobium zhengyangense]